MILLHFGADGEGFPQLEDIIPPIRFPRLTQYTQNTRSPRKKHCPIAKNGKKVTARLRFPLTYLNCNIYYNVENDVI